MNVHHYTRGAGKGYAKCTQRESPNARKTADLAAKEYFTKKTILNHLSGLSDKEAIDALAKVAHVDAASPDGRKVELLQEKHDLEMKLLLAEIELKNNAVSSASGNTQVMSELAKTSRAQAIKDVNDLESIVAVTFDQAAENAEDDEEDEEDDEEEEDAK